MSNLNTSLSEQAGHAAQTRFAEIDGARAVVIATPDGFDLAHAGHHAIDPARLAAMVSSFAALGDAASRETGIGTPRCLVIESSEGRLVVRCMQMQGQAIVVVEGAKTFRTVPRKRFDLMARSRHVVR